MNITYEATPRKATPADFGGIIRLLQASQLPTGDLSSDLPHFFVIEKDGEIIASAGVEIYRNLGLIRSVAVDEDYRKRSLATILLDRLMSYVSVQQITALYLITTTAERYFAQKGFHSVNRDKVPAPIALSSEFTTICPSTAIVMMKELPQ